MPTVDAVVTGPWGLLAGTETAVVTVPTVTAGPWGGWTGVATSVKTVQANTFDDWGDLFGAAAVVKTVPAAPTGAWGGLGTQVLFLKVEPVAAWELIAGLSSTTALFSATMENSPAVPLVIIDGSVSVDYDRTERRVFDLTIDGTGIVVGPTGLWYDTVIRLYRGVQVTAADLAAANPTDLAFLQQVNGRLYPIGTFLIDTIEQPHFPNQIHLTGRDFTKKLLLAKFTTATSWAISNGPLDPTGFTLTEILLGVIQAGGYGNIFIEGGPNAGNGTLPAFAYEAGTSFWTALKEVVTSQGYNLWYDVNGDPFAMRFVDPVTSPVTYTFQTGVGGNLASYTKSTNDSEIYNHVIVIGQTTDRLPVWGSATNTTVTSPTRIAVLGERLLRYDSTLVDDNTKASALAAQILRISALESFTIDMDSLVLPWLDVGMVIQFTPPNPDPGDPVNFLLTNLEIPLGPGTMKVTAKRITIVG